MSVKLAVSAAAAAAVFVAGGAPAHADTNLIGDNVGNFVAGTAGWVTGGPTLNPVFSSCLQFGPNCVYAPVPPGDGSNYYLAESSFTNDTLTTSFAATKGDILTVKLDVANDFTDVAGTNGSELKIVVNGQTIYDLTPVPNTNGFYGTIDISNITALSENTLALDTHDTQGVFAIAGVSVTEMPGVAPAVPEPATWAMMLTGFAAIGGTLRIRRRVNRAVAA
jgi:PEP-CTERM motif